MMFNDDQWLSMIIYKIIHESMIISSMILYMIVYILD